MQGQFEIKDGREGAVHIEANTDGRARPVHLVVGHSMEPNDSSQWQEIWLTPDEAEAIGATLMAAGRMARETERLKRGR
ncbi:hypothetical protein ACFOGJ_08945 [Marinibaculum pumilum]|uniref:Uncharacterized protein n=1 Tax=Marinibaculum pumilum TaxID=1766165 RepID=A0ABV7KZ02_9PROT